MSAPLALLRRSLYQLASVASLAACGGQSVSVALQEGGLGDANDASATGFDAWTKCRAPDGVEVCGMPQCSDDQCACYVGGDNVADGGILEYCGTSPGVTAYPCSPCSVDEVCLDRYTHAFDPLGLYGLCEPVGLGVLFGRNDAGDRVWFSDFSSWSEDAIAPASVCPTIPGVSLCGDPCGQCPQGEMCTGRSPVHPFGWCAPAKRFPLLPRCTAGTNSCGSGAACFTYAVQAAAQRVADANGFCMEITLCDALASQLPGGARCTH